MNIFSAFSQGISNLANPTRIEKFESALQTVTFDSLLVVPHGFGVKPDLVQVYLVCVVNDAALVAHNGSGSAANMHITRQATGGAGAGENLSFTTNIYSPKETGLHHHIDSKFTHQIAAGTMSSGFSGGTVKTTTEQTHEHI